MTALMHVIFIIVSGWKLHILKTIVTNKSVSLKEVGLKFCFGKVSSGKDFPGGSDSEECACNAGDLDLIPGFGRSSGEGKVYPL